VVVFRYCWDTPEEIPVAHLEQIKIQKPLASWMQDTAVENKTIFDLTIPGSHDSGAVCCPNTNSYFASWTICQRLSAKEQLEIGVRYFDLRLTDLQSDSVGCKVLQKVPGEGERIWISHSFCTMSLRRFLHDMQQFFSITESQREIVLMQLMGDNGSDLSCDGWNCVYDLFQEHGFGDKLATRPDLKVPLKDLMAKGINAFLLTSNCCISDSTEKKMEHFIDTQGLLQTSWFTTNSTTSAALLDKLTYWLEDKQGLLRQKTWILKLGCEITPDTNTIKDSLLFWKAKGEIFFNTEEAAAQAHRVIRHGLAEKWVHLDMNAIITHDFVSRDIVEAIVSINFRSKIC